MDKNFIYSLSNTYNSVFGIQNNFEKIFIKHLLIFSTIVTLDSQHSYSKNFIQHINVKTCP